MSPDEQVEALRRELEADPKDAALRSRYLGALIRAGQGRRARNLIRDGFLCRWSWNDFKATGRPGVRFCDDCQSEVFLALTREEIAEHAAQGHCVTAGADLVMGYVDDHIARTQSGSEPAAPPCVSEHRYESRPLDLKNVDLGLARQESWLGGLVRARRCLPIAREGDQVIVAFAEPPSVEDLEDVSFISAEDKLRPILVEGAILDQLIDMLYPDFEGEMLAGLMMEDV